MINVKIFQVFTSEMILLSKFYVMIISYVFIKNFILYSNHFKHIRLFISIFIATILLPVHIYAVRVAYTFFCRYMYALHTYFLTIVKEHSHYFRNIDNLLLKSVSEESSDSGKTKQDLVKQEAI